MGVAVYISSGRYIMSGIVLLIGRYIMSGCALVR